jgi:hypothetical protein
MVPETLDSSGTAMPLKVGGPICCLGCPRELEVFSFLRYASKYHPVELQKGYYHILMQ